MLSFESPTRTPWHRVPVLWKFIGLFLCSLLLVFVDVMQIQLAALVCCLVLYSVGGMTFLLAGIQRLKFLWPMLLLILGWHWYSNTSQTGWVVVIRLVTIVGLSNLVTMTSRLSDLVALLERALLPLGKIGINTRPVEMAIALVLRFTPVLIGKTALLRDAWRLRSKKNPNWRIVFPVCLVAIDDAEQVAMALKARGGTSRRPRSEQISKVVSTINR